MRLPNSWSNLPRLQSLRRKFPPTGRTSRGSWSLPSSQDRPATSTILAAAEFLPALPTSRRNYPGTDTWRPCRPPGQGSHPVTWTPVLSTAFDECKASLSRSTIMAHADSSSTLALVTDASTTAMGAVQQQRLRNARQTFAFFSRKRSPVQQMYSA